MTTNHSSTTALGWESDFWKMVEEGGNGANIEFVMKIRDFIHKVIEQAKEESRSELIEWLKGQRKEIDNSKKDIAGVYYEGWKAHNEAIDSVISKLEDKRKGGKV